MYAATDLPAAQVIDTIVELAQTREALHVATDMRDAIGIPDEAYAAGNDTCIELADKCEKITASLGSAITPFREATLPAYAVTASPELDLSFHELSKRGFTEFFVDGQDVLAFSDDAVVAARLLDPEVRMVGMSLHRGNPTGTIAWAGRDNTAHAVFAATTFLD